MTKYIFLTKSYSEGSTTYYAIPKDKIETLNLSGTYVVHGQKVSHADAGDSLTLDTAEAVEKANAVEDGKGDYSLGNSVSAYDDSETFDAMLDEEGVTVYNETVEGFNYWDGHNWRTVTVSCDSGEPSHAILDDEDLTNELNTAIENKEFEKEGFGRKIYASGGWVIIDNYCQGVWASYEIMSSADYEVTIF